MNNRGAIALLIAGATLAVLAGCATPPGQFRTFGNYVLVPASEHGECNASAGNCNVKVEVIECAIKAAPKVLVVRERGRGVSIHWKMHPANSPYNFQPTPRGIEIINGGSEFDCARDNNPKHYTCKNKHSTAGDYKYWIRLEAVAGMCGGRPLEVDPFIVND